MFVYQALTVRYAIFGQMVGDIKQIDLYLIAFLQQQPRHGKCVATVITRTGKDHHWGIAAPLFGNGAGKGIGSPLHQVNRLDRFMFYCISVKLMYLSTRKYLHNRRKFTK